MRTYAIRVSKTGDDVLTTTSKDLRFDSLKSAMKIYKWDDVSFTTDGSGDYTYTIPHNLGYAPAFYVMRKATAVWSLLSATEYTNAYFPVGSYNHYVKNDPLNDRVHAYADATNLYIQVVTGTASLAMEFRYYILVDNSQAFSTAGGPGLTKKYGFKVAKQGYDVQDGQEYQMGYSSKYKALQYFKANQQTSTITLPAMFASDIDTEVEEATYVDFEHGLGYPPLFVASSDQPLGNAGEYFEIPIPVAVSGISDANGPTIYINGWADSTRVRIYYYRDSFIHPTTGALVGNWSSSTITIKCTILSERLNGETNP